MGDVVAFVIFLTGYSLHFIDIIAYWLQNLGLVLGFVMVILKIIYQIDFHLKFRKEFKQHPERGKIFKMKVRQFKEMNHREEII